MLTFKHNETPKGLSFFPVHAKPQTLQACVMAKPFSLKTFDGSIVYGKPGDYLLIGVTGTVFTVTPEGFVQHYVDLNSHQTREEFVADKDNQRAAGELAKDISDKMRDNWFDVPTFAKRCNLDPKDAEKKLAYCILFGLLRSKQDPQRGLIYKIELSPQHQLLLMEEEHAAAMEAVADFGKRIATFKAVHGLQ